MTPGVTDEFMEPVVCARGPTFQDNDSVIFSFRPDRAGDHPHYGGRGL